MTAKYWIEDSMYLIPEDVAGHVEALEASHAMSRDDAQRQLDTADERIAALSKRLEDAETLAEHWMSGGRAYPFTEKHNRLHAAATRILSRTDKRGGGA